MRAGILEIASLYDFDDICKGLFVVDLTMVVFDLGVIMQCERKTEVVRNLAGAIVDSYNQSSTSERIHLSEVEEFLKLLELSLFIQCYDFYTRSSPLQGWLKLFYEGREERILSDAPFLAWK